MSKTATRYSHTDALVIANFALDATVPYCVQGAIAGSIRRGRPDVGDVDLVVELTSDNPWARSQLGAEIMSRLNYDVVREGEQTIHLEPHGAAARPAIDVYLATQRTFGMTLLVRTGSAAHNAKLASHAQKKCLPARRFTLHGIEDTAGKVIAGETEREVFGALGLPYIEPTDREAPEWERFVAPEAT